MSRKKQTNPVTSHKYKEGEDVIEKIHPSKKLIIIRYADGIYYCRVPETPNRKELVFFEWELMADPHLPQRKSPSVKEWLEKITT